MIFQVSMNDPRMDGLSKDPTWCEQNRGEFLGCLNQEEIAFGSKEQVMEILGQWSGDPRYCVEVI